MQHSFTIAIDLDETLAGTFRKIFEYGAKKHGWTVPFEEAVIQHDWWKIPSLQLDEITAYQLFDEYFLSDPNDSFIPPIAGAKNGILELRKMGINSHIITARTESIRKKATRAWLARHMPEFDFDNQVHFTNHYELVGSRSKWEVCQAIGAKILIDDNLEFLHNASSCGVFGILLDKPWNRDGTLNDRMHRVQNWEEITDFIHIHRQYFIQ